MKEGTGFGGWLKERRKARDLTQAELARRVGCAVVTIHKIETGALRPSREIAERLAVCLDVPAAERARFAAFARGGPVDGAGKRFGPPRPHNLPAQLTPLIGREMDMEAVRQRVLEEGARLVTLVGPPGVGKTRLALAAAADLLEYYEDGVFFVDLASSTDPSLILPMIAEALDVQPSGAGSPSRQVRSYLSDRHLLLVLDNFEQIVEGAAQVADLLHHCPWLYVLVTSRQPLRLRGERQIHVRPLAVPPEAPQSPGPARSSTRDIPVLAEITCYPAVALFLEHAQAADAEFTLTSANVAAVSALCRRLDGLPLAIELVAPRIRLLPPAALLDRLTGSLLLSADGQRGVDVRQKTLRNALDWSYRLLPPAEQALFARLGAFAGGFSLEAVEEVCDGVILDSMASLLDKNLLRREIRPDGAPRFMMLETVREYALECLDARGEQTQSYQRHAAYFMRLAEQAAPHLRARRQMEWLGCLTTEQANLRIALGRALEFGWSEIAMRLAGALFYFWHVTGYVAEGRRWLQRTVSLAEEDPASRGSIWRARTLLGYAVLHVWQDDQARRQACLRTALEISEQAGDAWCAGYALQNLAWMAQERGEYAAAHALGERSLAVWQAASDTWGVSLAHYTLALIVYQQADWPAWRSHLQDALAFARKAGDRWILAPALKYLGLEVWQTAGPVAGRPLFEESLAAFREIGNQEMVATLLDKLGEVMRDQGDYVSARVACEQALALLGSWPDDWEVPWALYCLGSIAFQSGDLAAARERFEACLASFAAFDNDVFRWLKGFVLGHEGHLALHQGDLALATACLDGSWTLLSGRLETVDVSLPAFGRAELACFQGQWQQAMSWYGQSLSALRGAGRAVNVADCLEGLALSSVMQGRPQHAARLLGAAEALRQRLGTPLPAVERANYVRCIAAVRGQLAEIGFAATWAEGYGMALEQAAAYALDLARL